MDLHIGAISKDGANVLIEDHAGRICMVKSKDHSFWMLPGGRLESGEDADQAAVREVREETFLRIRIADLQPIAIMEQRFVGSSETGLVSLYRTSQYGGKLIGTAHKDDIEILERAFMPLEEIFDLWKKDPHSVGRAYLRMIAIFSLKRDGHLPQNIYQGRLRDYVSVRGLLI